MSNEVLSRRQFLEFLGKSAAAASLAGAGPLLSSCASVGGSVSNARLVPSNRMTPTAAASGLPFTALAPTSEDALRLADGFRYQTIIRWGDTINRAGDTFGTNNDYLAFLQLGIENTDAILWCNHEAPNPLFVNEDRQARLRAQQKLSQQKLSQMNGKVDQADRKTREQVVAEQLSVGGSLLRVHRNTQSGEWNYVKNDSLNRRLTARTRIPFAAPRPIMGSRVATGTLANCAGGVTPWGTFLTCEENYQDFYGEAVYDSITGTRQVTPSKLGWEEHFPHPPEHYGWVVEVNPLTGHARKLTSLGRFCHECATVRPARDGRCVVYMGDDGENRCLYKFIADKPGSLETGSLYVANLEKGRWESLSHKDQKILRDIFKDQTDVLIRAREAAFIVGGSALDRPEDIEIDPASGSVLIALTQNLTKGNLFGSLLRVVEKDNDPLSLEFQHSTYTPGGVETGFACPDNLAIDPCGNLWMTCDISGKSLNKAPFDSFGNNSLFYIPMRGPKAGKAFRVASAPNDAEFTGPCFAPDGKTLFLSVQHPGEESKSLDALTSHWPDGSGSLPRSTVVAISGPAMDQLVGGPRVSPIFAPLVRTRHL